MIEVAQSKPRAVSPDVSVWRTDPHLPTQGAVTVIDPPLAQSAVALEVPVRLARVEVHDAGADTLVTAIEILTQGRLRPLKAFELEPVQEMPPVSPRPMGAGSWAATWPWLDG